MDFDQANPLRDFIIEEYHAKADEAFYEQMQAEEEAKLKAVTVRLHPEVLATVDGFAKFFEISRQKMMEQIIEGGIALSFSSLADAEIASRPEYPGMTEDEQKQLWREIRLRYVKEIGE